MFGKIFKKQDDDAVVNESKEAQVASDILGEDAESETKKSSPEKDAERIARAHPWLKQQYASGGRRYMDVYAGIAQNVAQWRLISIAFMLILTVSVVGNVYMAMAVKIQPFVVQVDEHGYSVPIQPANRTNIDHRIITSQIGQFIFNMRTRVTDKAAQVYFAKTSYKSIGENSNAVARLNEYFKQNVPTASAVPTEVDITAVLPISDNTYQAEWTEKTGKDVKHYQGIFEIVISPPSDTANLINNPLGIYIVEFQVHAKLN